MNEKYRWSCSKCGTSGEVVTDPGTSVLTVEDRIRSSHHQTSPQCADAWGASYVTTDQTAPLPD